MPNFFEVVIRKQRHSEEASPTKNLVPPPEILRFAQDDGLA